MDSQLESLVGERLAVAKDIQRVGEEIKIVMRDIDKTNVEISKINGMSHT